MSLFEYPNGRMWIGTNDGLNILENNVPIPFEHTSIFKGLHILAIAALKDTVWVGTMEKGLFFYY